jgi:hypothetical protein
MGSPFGTEEGAALVAVERANGGELAPLEQVLWALDAITPPGEHPDPARFSRSVGLLIRVGVVEYLEGQLGLSVEGRKLLRRSGLLNDPRHVAHVTALLQGFDEIDMEDRDGGDELPAPSEAEVARALRDGEEIEETPGAMGTPILGEEVTVGSAVFGAAGWTAQWVPAVIPDSSAEPEMGPPPAGYPGAPAHPILDRLFGRKRKDDP